MITPNPLDDTTKLMPVDEWEWFLYEVTYTGPNTKPLVKYAVSTIDHIKHECLDHEYWPSDRYEWAEWKSISKAKRPRQISEMYGLRVDESAWAAVEKFLIESCQGPESGSWSGGLEGREPLLLFSGVHLAHYSDRT